MTTGRITAIAVGFSLVASSSAFGTMSRMPRTQGCPNYLSVQVEEGSCPQDLKTWCQSEVDGVYPPAGRCPVNSDGNSCQQEESGFYVTCNLQSE
jgi:hypothetical protein